MRLTKKEELPKVPCYVEVQEEHWKTKHRQQAIDKLGQLEDIEERYGIDLIIVLKALENGIFDKNRYYQGSCLSLSNGNLGLYIDCYDRLFPFDKYGIDWALTKGELLCD